MIMSKDEFINVMEEIGAKEKPEEAKNNNALHYDVYTEEDMELMVKALNLDLYTNGGILDSTILFDEAANLNYRSVLDEENQVYLFYKKVS